MLRGWIRIRLPPHHRIDGGWKTTTPAPGALGGMSAAMAAASTMADQTEGRTGRRSQREGCVTWTGRPSTRCRRPLGLARVVFQLRVATVQPGVDHEQHGDDGNDDDDREDDGAHRSTLLAPSLAPPSRWLWMARWRHRALIPGAGKAIRRDLQHLRLVMLITGSWPGGRRCCWPARTHGSARPGRPAWRGGRPPQAWPQLLGHDLHHRAGAAILGRPCPLLEPAQDHDPAAL